MKKIFKSAFACFAVAAIFFGMTFIRETYIQYGSISLKEINPKEQYLSAIESIKENITQFREKAVDFDAAVCYVRSSLEKIKKSLDVFMEKFGIRPDEIFKSSILKPMNEYEKLLTEKE